MAGRAGDDLNGAGERERSPRASAGACAPAAATLGWTLAETAGRADVAVSYLSSIEVGRSVPSLPILARVSTTLGLSLNEALRGLGQQRRRRRAARQRRRRESSAPRARALELEIGTLVADPGAPARAPCRSAAASSSSTSSPVHARGGARRDGLRCCGRATRSTRRRPPRRAGRVPDEERSVSVWSTVPGS